ncbi:hypothetical protein BDCR2A_01459 [Borrelia duttonii CR2A]|uniref:Uncharacterized protein n=1 Tax=Borrelia duttonii CR2A TaxID=1432657 RepID=W6TK66_9SPIR|nr:hypothetical protein BDCR2A_01459 [Borrelia duttonii CR2A]
MLQNKMKDKSTKTFKKIKIAIKINLKYFKK